MLTTDATRYLLAYGSARRQWLLAECVCWLTAIGMLQAWIAAILFAQGLRTGLDQWGNSIAVENKSIVYYLAHGGSIASLLLAGTIAGINGSYQRLDTLARLAIWLLVLASTLWAIVAYSLDEMTSAAILGATGPIVWLSSIIMLAGTEDKTWDRLEGLVDPMVVTTAILALGSIYGAGPDSPAAMLRTNHYFSLLFWLAGWRCLGRTYRDVVWILLDCAMLVILWILALWLQRRSWVIDMGLLTSIYLYTLGRRAGSLARPAYGLAILAVATGAVILTVPSLRQALSGLMGRISEDTRSEQYRIFFSQVEIGDLVLGLGPKATYYYGPASPRYQFFDNAYIWMAFIGGLPILVSYCLLILRPGLVALVRSSGQSHQVRASAIMLGIWALVLGGLGVFSCPSLNAYHYLVCLMAGLCWASL